MPHSPQWYRGSGSGRPDEPLLWPSWDLVSCWLPLATSTEVEEGGADEEEDTVEGDCWEDEERRDACGGSPPMPLIPTPPDAPPTRPDEELWLCPLELLLWQLLPLPWL